MRSASPTTNTHGAPSPDARCLVPARARSRRARPPYVGGCPSPACPCARDGFREIRGDVSCDSLAILRRGRGRTSACLWCMPAGRATLLQARLAHQAFIRGLATAAAPSSKCDLFPTRFSVRAGLREALVAHRGSQSGGRARAISGGRHAPICHRPAAAERTTTARGTFWSASPRDRPQHARAPSASGRRSSTRRFRSRCSHPAHAGEPPRARAIGLAPRFAPGPRNAITDARLLST